MLPGSFVRFGLVRAVLLGGLLVINGCGGEENVVEPMIPEEGEGPAFDHIPNKTCYYTPEFTRSSNDSTETITITFEGWTYVPPPSDFQSCWIEPVEGVTFGVVGGAQAPDDSLWVARADTTLDPFSFEANEPSPTSFARLNRSNTGDLFFDPPVSSVGFYYCYLENDDSHYVYAFNAAGGIVDSEPAPGNRPGIYCTVWDSVRLQATSDVIVKIRITGASYTVIDDLSFTRRIPPGVSVSRARSRVEIKLPAKQLNRWTLSRAGSSKARVQGERLLKRRSPHRPQSGPA